MIDLETLKVLVGAAPAAALVVFVTIYLTRTGRAEREKMADAFRESLEKQSAGHERRLELIMASHERTTSTTADKIERVAVQIGEQHVEAVRKLERICATLERYGNGYRGQPPT